MLSELQRKNISTVFDVLDRDRDGTITRRDFEVTGQVVCDEFGIARGTERYAEVLDVHLHWWDQIRSGADSDAGGGVSRDEYLSAVERGLLNHPRYTEVVEAVGVVVFGLGDRDGDGYLTVEGMREIYGAVGLGSETSAASFAQIDADGDGRINRAEWLAAIRGAFTGTGGHEPGSNMFGHAEPGITKLDVEAAPMRGTIVPGLESV